MVESIKYCITYLTETVLCACAVPATDSCRGFYLTANFDSVSDSETENELPVILMSGPLTQCVPRTAWSSPGRRQTDDDQVSRQSSVHNWRAIHQNTAEEDEKNEKSSFSSQKMASLIFYVVNEPHPAYS